MAEQKFREEKKKQWDHVIGHNVSSMLPQRLREALISWRVLPDLCWTGTKHAEVYLRFTINATCISRIKYLQADLGMWKSPKLKAEKENNALLREVRRKEQQWVASLRQVNSVQEDPASWLLLKMYPRHELSTIHSLPEHSMRIPLPTPPLKPRLKVRFFRVNRF